MTSLERQRAQAARDATSARIEARKQATGFYKNNPKPSSSKSTSAPSYASPSKSSSSSPSRSYSSSGAISAPVYGSTTHPSYGNTRGVVEAPVMAEPVYYSPPPPVYQPPPAFAYNPSSQVSSLWDQAQQYLQQMNALNSQGFKYDPNSDEVYKSAQQQSEVEGQKATKNSMEDLNSRGILNSTITADRIGEIQNDGRKYLSSLIPGLAANAQNQWQGRINNLGSLYSQMLNQYNNNRNFEFNSQQTQYQNNYNAGRDAIGDYYNASGGYYPYNGSTNASPYTPQSGYNAPVMSQPSSRPTQSSSSSQAPISGKTWGQNTWSNGRKPIQIPW